MSQVERRNLSNRPFANQANQSREANVSTKKTNSARVTEQEDAAMAAADPAPAQIFEQLDGKQKVEMQNDMDMIMDIPVQLTVQLGRTKIAIKSLLQLAQGSVVELDGLAGEPMDVLVNGYLIAQGEVVVVNERFGIRLTDIITPSERIRKLNR